MTQQELAAAGALDEEAPPEADPKSEFEFQQELDFKQASGTE